MISYYASGRKPPTDLLLYDAEDELVATVETSPLTGETAEWAADLRARRMRRALPATRFYLIVTPDRIFLWKDVLPIAEAIPPTRVIDARPVLDPYYRLMRTAPDRQDQEGFKDLVRFWIADLAGRRRLMPSDSERGWAEETGFLTAINGGMVRYAHLAA